MSVTISKNIIHIIGEASKKQVASIEVSSEDYQMTVMEFLRAKGIPVASSCFGEGICRKCVVKCGNEEFLSCLLTVKTLLEQDKTVISISYI